MTVKPYATILVAVSLSTTLLADLGDITFGPVDLAHPGLGVQYLDGRYYVTARGIGATPPHMVWVYNTDGVLILGAEFVQHPNTQSSSWGYRDGASDGTFLYYGDEAGLYRHEADGTNATQIVTGSSPVSTWRALAHDPTLASGAGGFWVASFGSALIAVDMTGNLLEQFPNLDNWSISGLAFDAFTGNVWAATGPAPSQIAEIDTATGRFTGRAFLGGEGGLSEVPGGAGGSANRLDVATILDGSRLVGYEILGGACLGDLNGDGRTDLTDLGILLADFGCAAPGPCPGDLDGDGDTDLADLGILLADFGCAP
jgi:hypothetical protein